MRKHGRIDDNQPEIVRNLEVAGAHVQSLANIGAGCPDLLVSYRQQWHVLEIKNPETGGKLNQEQENWHRLANAPVHVVCNTMEALKAIGALEDGREWM